MVVPLLSGQRRKIGAFHQARHLHAAHAQLVAGRLFANILHPASYRIDLFDKVVGIRIGTQLCRGFLNLEGLRLQGACIQRHQRQGMGEGVVSLRGYRIRKLLIIQVVAKGSHLAPGRIRHCIFFALRLLQGCWVDWELYVR